MCSPSHTLRLRGQTNRNGAVASPWGSLPRIDQSKLRKDITENIALATCLVRIQNGNAGKSFNVFAFMLSTRPQRCDASTKLFESKLRAEKRGKAHSAQYLPATQTTLTHRWRPEHSRWFKAGKQEVSTCFWGLLLKYLPSSIQREGVGNAQFHSQNYSYQKDNGTTSEIYGISPPFKSICWSC